MTAFPTWKVKNQPIKAIQNQELACPADLLPPALVIRATALKQRHALEEQERVMQKKREMLELNTQLAAAEAKIAVLKSPRQHGRSHTHSDGMVSNFDKGTRLKKPSVTLNPDEVAYQPSMQQQSIQQPTSMFQQPPPQQVQVQHSTYNNHHHYNANVQHRTTVMTIKGHKNVENP